MKNDYVILKFPQGDGQKTDISTPSMKCSKVQEK